MNITGVVPDAVSKMINRFVPTVNNPDKINPTLFLAAKEYIHESDGTYSARMKNGRKMQEKADIHHIIHIHIPAAPSVV